MQAISLWCATVLFALFASQSDPLLDGIVHFQRGEYAAAETSLQEAVRTRDDRRARAFLALTQAAMGRCDAAVPELEKQFPDVGEPELRRLTGLGLAQCYVSAGQIDSALNVMVRLKNLYPSDADVLYETARIYMKSWNEAVRDMFQQTPASFRVNQLSGEIFESQGRYAEAVEQFREAIAKNPKALDLHFRAGRSLLMSSHSADTLSQALQEFEAELALNPGDSVAEYEVGLILLSEHKAGDAQSHLERAVRLNPTFPEALITLAKMKLEAKQNDEAIALLNRALQLVPESITAHYNLMIAYRNAGRSDDALREQQKLDKLQKPPEGEFMEFLKKLGNQVPPK